MTLILFDIDGTLTLSGEKITNDMSDHLQNLYQKDNIILGLVGGGSLDKIKYQMGNSIKYFKYIFAECGAVLCMDDVIVSEKNLIDHCDRTLLNSIIKKALRCISDMPILYHGNQIDFRKGLVYISPPGMQATQLERQYFLEKDNNFSLRKNLLEELKSLDTENQFEMYFGGSVGIALHPRGWNKSQVIKILLDMNVNDKLVYFGDRTEPDGNDYPIYSHYLIEGYSVIDYQDTINKLNKLYLR